MLIEKTGSKRGQKTPNEAERLEGVGFFELRDAQFGFVAIAAGYFNGEAGLLACFGQGTLTRHNQISSQKGSILLKWKIIAQIWPLAQSICLLIVGFRGVPKEGVGPKARFGGKSVLR